MKNFEEMQDEIENKCLIIQKRKEMKLKGISRNQWENYLERTKNPFLFGIL